MANFVLLKLIVFATVATGIPADLTERECRQDQNCKSHEFCETRVQQCKSCVDCSAYNRQIAEAKCPKTPRECGACSPGHYTVLLGKEEIVCENGKKIFTRRLSSTNDTEPNEDESDSVPAWVYACSVIAGLILGFAVGGVSAILAYKLYFGRKNQRKQENQEEKSVELHEMLPEEFKYTLDSQERGEVAYGLIVNNTKHFPEVKNPDSRRNQELIPLQGNAAPVVSNTLYYAEDNKGI